MPGDGSLTEVKVERDFPLSQLCTYGIGGNAAYLTVARSINEMQRAVEYAREKGLSFFVLGKGSNCLFDDRGFSGLIIQNRMDSLEILEPGIWQVGSGYSFSLLGARTARDGWTGLEFASGIPGTCGGAVYMNAGAGGVETADVLLSVSYLHQDGTFQFYDRGELSFSYRTSPFQKMRGVIISTQFALRPSLEARDCQLELIGYRKKTQPYEDKSAGCVFRNPEGKSAGAIIEQVGLKGVSVGGAMVSTKHGNFIVNKGGASADDVRELVDTIQDRVKESLGLELEREVCYVPYMLDD